MRQYKGTIIMHVGSMFSGKTSALLEDLRRFEIAGYKVALLKPSIDTRYDENKVVSHLKVSRGAININTMKDIIDYIEEHPDIEVIGIDEFQFIDNIIDGTYLKNIFDYITSRDITIVIAGLDLDFKGNPFKNIKEAMPFAKYLYKHHAVCVDCGNDAWISYRKTNDEEQIKLGGEDIYIPLCEKCYKKRTENEKKEV